MGGARVDRAARAPGSWPSCREYLSGRTVVLEDERKPKLKMEQEHEGLQLGMPLQLKRFFSDGSASIPPPCAAVGSTAAVTRESPSGSAATPRSAAP